MTFAKVKRNVGDEFVRRRSSAKEDRFVVVGHHGGHSVKKRKAVLVIESMLGRVLTWRECLRVKFLDGDRLNCNPQNLLLAGLHDRVRACDVCGKIMLGTVGRPFHGLCRICRITKMGRESHIYRREARLLSDTGVSLLKAVVNNKKLIHHGKKGWGRKTVAGWFEITQWSVRKISEGLSATYKEIKPMPADNVWRALLDQHDKLKAKATSTLYDRVTLLKRVFDDEHYRGEMIGNNRSLTQELDSRLSDTCANFTELMMVLRKFPERKQWLEGDVAQMRDSVLRELRESKGDAALKNNRNRTLSWKKKFLELEQQYKELLAAHKQLQNDHRELQKVINQRLAS